MGVLKNQGFEKEWFYYTFTTTDCSDAHYFDCAFPRCFQSLPVYVKVIHHQYNAMYLENWTNCHLIGTSFRFLASLVREKILAESVDILKWDFIQCNIIKSSLTYCKSWNSSEGTCQSKCHKWKNIASAWITPHSCTLTWQTGLQLTAQPNCSNMTLVESQK